MEKTKQMHDEERSWKLSLLADIMVPNNSQWRTMSYRYSDRILANTEVKKVRKVTENHGGSKEGWVESKKSSTVSSCT